jgi:DNA sulfur modification protein DndB
LRRSQQMFADLNKYAIRPSGSLSTLYDHREPASNLARYLADTCTIFKGMTELEKSSISNRSIKLFTLSSIKHASRALLRKGQKDPIQAEEQLLALDYWEAVGESIPDWTKARSREISTYDLRQNFVHAHGIALHALGMAGAELLASEPRAWRRSVKRLKGLDWSRKNKGQWEGRAMVHGRISKARSNLQLTAAAIKKTFGLNLNESDVALEKAMR